LSDTDFAVNIRQTVSDIRKIAPYIKNSTAAKEKEQLLDAICKGGTDIATNDANSPLLTLILDVSIRCNSAYDMLTKLLKYKDSIISFLKLLKDTAGRSEFYQKKYSESSDDTRELILVESYHGRRSCRMVHRYYCLLYDLGISAYELYQLRFSFWVLMR